MKERSKTIHLLNNHKELSNLRSKTSTYHSCNNLQHHISDDEEENIRKKQKNLKKNVRIKFPLYINTNQKYLNQSSLQTYDDLLLISPYISEKLNDLKSALTDKRKSNKSISKSLITDNVHLRENLYSSGKIREKSLNFSHIPNFDDYQFQISFEKMKIYKYYFISQNVNKVLGEISQNKNLTHIIKIKKKNRS